MECGSYCKKEDVLSVFNDPDKTIFAHCNRLTCGNGCVQKQLELT